MNIDLILYIGAAICFGLQAFGVGSRVNLGALAFCFITLALWIV